MVAPTLLVELPAETVQAARADALVAACTEALRHGACVAADSTPEHAPAVAQLAWEAPEARRLTVRVGLLRAEGREWIEGRLVFDEGDSPEDRWRAAGFTIGTLAGDLTEILPAPHQGRVIRDTPVTSSTVVERPAPVHNSAGPEPRSDSGSKGPFTGSSPSTAVRLHLEGGGVLGPGVDGEPWRVGGFAQAQIHTSSLGLWVDLAYARARGVLLSQWGSAAVGTGPLFAIAGGLVGGVSVGAGVELFRAALVDADEHLHGTETLPIGLVRGELHAAGLGSWALVLTADLRLAPHVLVRAGQQAYSLPSASALIRVGVALDVSE